MEMPNFYLAVFNIRPLIVVFNKKAFTKVICYLLFIAI